MSEEPKFSLQELRGIIRMLEKTSRLAHEATMTGSLEDGYSYAVQQFNAIVATLAQQGIRLPAYFPPLGADANWGAVGVACAQVAEYLKGMLDAEKEAGAAGSGGTFFDRFFGSGEFQHIGEAMQEAMPEWLRESRRWRRAARSGEAAGPTAPGAERPAESHRTGELESRLAELSARLAATAAQMRQPGITPEELQRLAAELARLGEEQARIVREAGTTSGSDRDVDVDVDV